MFEVIITPAAQADLEGIIVTHTLPSDARDRIRARLRDLERLPRMGSPLDGRWQGARFLLGPWPWMLVIYRVHDEEKRVSIITVQDARRASSATTNPRV